MNKQPNTTTTEPAPKRKRTTEERIAELQAKLDADRLHGSTRIAAEGALSRVKAKEYGAALTSAKALVALLEKLNGNGAA